MQFLIYRILVRDAKQLWTYPVRRWDICCWKFAIPVGTATTDILAFTMAGSDIHGGHLGCKIFFSLLFFHGVGVKGSMEMMEGMCCGRL